MIIAVPNSTFQVSQLSGDTLYIVGFNISLSQADVPYTIPGEGPLPLSTTDLAVYGDTVTISDDLFNPGRTIAIYARQIIIEGAACINVSGADPQTSYAPGDVAEQTDSSAGAPGATGATASNGSSGETIVLAAESIQVQGTDAGAGTPLRAICLQQAIARATAAALPSYQATSGLSSLSLPKLDLPWQIGGLSVDVDVDGVSVTGAQDVRALEPTYDSTTSTLSVALNLGPMALQASTLQIGSGPLGASGSLSAVFDLTLTLAFSIGATPAVISPTAQTLSVQNISLTPQGFEGLGEIEANTAVTNVVAPAFPNYLQTNLTSALSSAMAALADAVAGAFLPTEVGSNAALILMAQGGSGGRGQDGHDGIQGATGTAGQNTDHSVAPGQPPPPQTIGGSGQAGGQGGSAGQSGAGGSGGSIAINLIQAPTIGIAIATGGGPGGAAASAGAPGTGGPGGQGGTYYVGILSGPFQQERAPTGAPGSPGLPAAFQGAMGGLGPAGQGGPLGSFTYDQLAPSLPLYQLIFEQQATKIAYLNAQTSADYQNVITLFTWLQNITAMFTATPVPSNTGLTSTDIATRAAIYQAATLELARLNASLDYYGNPANWAPVLTWSWLDTRVSQQIALGNDIQTEYQNASTPSQQATAAQNASTSLNNDLTNIQASQMILQQQITALDKQIASLLSQIDQQIIIINQDFSTLQQQYTQQQTSCTFSDVLNALSAIVQLGLSEWLGAKDLTTALGVEQAGANLLQGAGNLVLQAQPSDSSYSALSGAWQSLQSTLQKYGPNSALITVADEQFDTLLTQYFGGLPEASAVEDDVNELINLVQTRNQMLLNYTSLYAQQQRLATQYQQKQAELENIAALLASAQQPQLPDYLAFLQSSLTEIGNNIVDNLYQENQAFEYWAVEDQPFSVSGLDMASLAIAANNLENAVEAYLQGTTGRPFSPFQDISITIDKQQYTTAFARLVATNQLTLQIELSDPSNPFVNNYNVTVETISVSLPGITPPAGTATAPTVLQLNILQNGPDTLEAPTGTVLAFTHAPRPIIYEYNYTIKQVTITGTVGDPTQGFTGLSPFATWTIDFSPSTNSWLDLSQVESVQLTFTGQLLGPNAVSESTRD